MALYSPNQYLAFIHIYKTGGMSVRKAMKDIDPECFEMGEGHMDAPTMYQVFQDKDALTLYKWIHKFSVVRNPYSWLHSTYQFAVHTESHPMHHFAKNAEFNDFVKWYIRMQPMMNESGLFNGKIQTQTEYLYHNGKLQVDSLLKYENLANDFKNMMRFKGYMDDIHFPHINKTPYKLVDFAFMNDLSRSTINMINNTFEKDFINSDYQIL